MTYKSWVWSVLFWGGVIVTVLAQIEQPGEYGIPAAWMPYIKLGALIALAVGGKLGISYLKGEPKP